jgi:hypothetical protein
MAQPVLLCFEPWDVTHRLAELGLEESSLIQAGQAGFSALASCTENHPPGSPGYFAWAETVRTLRDLLAPSWTRKTDNNLSLTVNENQTMAILVATGDSDTGVKEGHPRTSAPKGSRTKGRVQANRYMEYLFPEMAADAASKVGPPTWILLIRCDAKSQNFRSELSRPIDMTEDGYVDEWAERIILAPTHFDELHGIMPYDEGGSPQTPELKIEIKAHA